MKPGRCALCQRIVNRITRHHLEPGRRHRRRSPTVPLCADCHRQIHRLFSNRVLAQELNSLERLQASPEIQTFVAWVQKQDPGRRIKVRTARFRK